MTPRPARPLAQLLAALALAATLAACEEKPAPPAPAPSPAAATPTAPAAPRPAAATPAPAAQTPPAPAAVTVLPSGQTTPEGVACDLTRAFITHDSRLLRASCFVITPGSPERDAYNNFIDETATKLDVATSVPSDQADWPVAITQVFRARDLSAPGPAAFGLDQHGLTAVRFVDLAVTLPGKSTNIRRTLVVQDEGSKLWFAVPHPENFPKLSEGLSGEAASQELWKP